MTEDIHKCVVSSLEQISTTFDTIPKYFPVIDNEVAKGNLNIAYCYATVLGEKLHRMEKDAKVIINAIASGKNNYNEDCNDDCITILSEE